MESTRQYPAKFDYEKLDVYRFALLFVEWVTPLLDETATLRKSKRG